MRLLSLVPITFALMSLGSAVAGTPTWGIALNEKTKECAYYAPGDKGMDYPLVGGWAAYYPDREYDVVSTPYGDCMHHSRDFGGCCQQIGLEVLTDENLRYSRETVDADSNGRSDHSVCVFMGLSQDASGISINMKTHQCTGLPVFALQQGGRRGVMDQSPEATEFCSSKSGWVQYNVEHRFEISTPAGTCNAASARECCNRWGYAWYGQLEVLPNLGIDNDATMCLFAMIYGPPVLLVLILFSKLVTKFIDERSGPKDGSP